MTTMKTLAIALSGVLIVCALAKAAPFDTGFILWTQPDGVTSFTAHAWGDEFATWMETQNGYRIVQDSTGWYYYATLDNNGDYTPTTSRVGIDAPPPPGSYKLERSMAAMSTIDQARAQADTFYSQAAAWFAQKLAAANGQPVTLQIGVVFVQFSDLSHYKDSLTSDLQYGYKKTTFDSMLGSHNYWVGGQGNAKHPEGEQIFGSMWDYYNQMSLGKLNLSFTDINPPDANGVPIWLTLGGGRWSYRWPGHMFPEALDSANSRHQADPAHWPNPYGYDKYIVIYAQNDDSHTKLTHADMVVGGPAIQVPERMGRRLVGQSNITFAHIGTYCHEFGHCLGWLDEYVPSEWADQGGTDILSYDLMARGNYNGPNEKGECPATLAPIHRIVEGWIAPVFLRQDTTNVTMAYNYSNPQIFRIDPIEKTNPNEHYLFETRLRQGFDTYVPNSPDSFPHQTGTLLVWHDSAQAGTKIDVIQILAADNTPPISDFDTSTQSSTFLTDFFPNNASTNRQTINDGTIPAATIGITNPQWNEPNNPRPAHFALNGIHRDLSSGYTHIDTILLRLPISQNTSWAGSVYAMDNLVVQNNVTLSVSPNTQVFFSPGKTLTVNGRLSAIGSSSQRITFTSSNATPSPGDWEWILSYGGGPDTLTYCDIKYAQTGLHLWLTAANSYMAHDTISQCSSDGLDVWSTGVGNTALKLYRCGIKNNGTDGIEVGSAKVSITYSRIENNGAWDINPGVCANMGAYVCIDSSRVQYNLGSGIEVTDQNSRASLSADEIQPGYNTVYQHGMGEIYVHNSASAFLGYGVRGAFDHCDCGGGEQSSHPIHAKASFVPLSNSPCPHYCTPVYRYTYQGGWNNVFDTLFTYNNCRLIDNETGNIVKAWNTYWGEDSVEFCGPVDASSPLQDPVATRAKAIFGSSGSEVLSINSDPMLFLRWLAQLKTDVQNDSSNAIDALHELALYVGPGGAYATALQTSWEDFLVLIENSSVLQNLKSAATAFRVQARMDQGQFVDASSLADQVLQRPSISDDMWLFCQTRKVIASVAVGDTAGAHTTFNSMYSRGVQIDKKAVEALKFYVDHAQRTGNRSTGELVKLSQKPRTVVPMSYKLEQNYPNPFNPTTRISYNLPTNAYVVLEVYDVIGRQVAILVNGYQEAGYRWAEFNASKFPSGVYFYRIQAGNFSNVKKMLLMK